MIRVRGVLDDHLRVHLDPVEHAGVRMQRVVLVGLEFGQHRRLPVGCPAVAFVPHQDESVPLRARIGPHADILLAADLAVRDQRIGAIAVPMPAMPRTHDVLALDGPADPHVRAEMLAVRVQHMHLPGLGAKQHQLLTEVMHPLHLADRQVRREPDDEPARRERYGDSPIPPGPNSRSDGSLDESATVFVTARSIPDTVGYRCVRTVRAIPAYDPAFEICRPLPIFTILGILGQGRRDKDGA